MNPSSDNRGKIIVPTRPAQNDNPLPPIGYVPQPLQVSPSEQPILPPSQPRFSRKKIVKLVVGLAVFTLLILTIASIHGSNPKSTPVATNEISITKNGFVPKVITINSGSEVTWTNNDSKVHAIGADPYPADNSISDFDSDIALQPKDSLSFIFVKPGTYTYHDQQNPHSSKYHGTIIVH
ncbi:MAG TPA: cupredoxin domain-containing protein [Candidatus Saccharimonadales bacterium]|nr:cupredoxin domain-containing protein [Candidatus Saccharimonadales bacterium]